MPKDIHRRRQKCPQWRLVKVYHQAYWILELIWNNVQTSVDLLTLNVQLFLKAEVEVLVQDH